MASGNPKKILRLRIFAGPNGSGKTTVSKFIGKQKINDVKSENKWKVYWLRANLKWTLYEPQPKVKSLKDFIKLVDEDKFHCFKG